MLELEGINYWAVIIAGLVNMAIGAWWYSQSGFGKQWTKHTGVDIMKIPEKEATRIIGFVAVSAFVQAFALAIVLNSLEVLTVANALLVALLLWLGFTAATTVGVTLYSKRSWKFLWLNSSYFLLVMSVNAIILTLWRYSTVV